MEKKFLQRYLIPNAGHPYYVVASDVATLDFLHNILVIPVPKVIDWSSRNSTSPPNPVDAEYIAMEKITSRQLCDAWPTMSEAQRFRYPLGKSIVATEAKLTTAKLPKYRSIYYRNDHPDGVGLEEPATLANPGIKDIPRFFIGHATQQFLLGQMKSKTWTSIEAHGIPQRNVSLQFGKAPETISSV